MKHLFFSRWLVATSAAGCRQPWWALLALLSWWLLPGQGQAQAPARSKWAAGLSAGYTTNRLLTDISNYDYNYYERAGGFVVAAPVQYAVADWLALQAEPGFIRKSFTLWEAVPGQEAAALTSRYDYLQLPLLAHFSFGGPRLRGFLHLGGYGAYWRAGHVVGTEPDIVNTYGITNTLIPLRPVDSDYEFDSRRDRRWQFGWLAGVGTQYAVSGRLSVVAEARYYQDRTDQQKDYMRNQMPRYNLTTSFSVGCLYRFAAQ